MENLKIRNFILNFLVVIMMFFLIRKGNERYIISFIFSLIIIFECIYRKKINFFNKGIIINCILYVIFLINSYLKNPIEGDMVFKVILCNFFFFLCLSQLEIEETFYNKILSILSFFFLLSSYRGFREWGEYGFSSFYRISKAGWATVYNIEIGVYIFISLFCLFTLKKNWLKILIGAIFLFSSFVLIGTHSRITLLLVPFFIFYIFIVYLIKNKKLNIRILIISFFVFFLLINIPIVKQHTQRLTSITSIEKIKNEARVKIYLSGIQDLKNNNYKSLGHYYYMNHPIDTHILHLHNNILEILVTQGIIAVISYISYNIFLFIALKKRRKEKNIKEQENMLYLSEILFLFINLAGIVDSNIYFCKANLIINFIYGISLCKVKAVEKIEN